MASTPEVFDSLPYIDTEISQVEREKAQRAVYKELSPDQNGRDHPLMQPPHEARFSNLIQQEIERCAAGQPPKRGIDLTRYEAPDEPAPGSDIQTYKDTLKNAYVSGTYLSGRRTNLVLLEEFGKNAWLIGNSELESLLKQLEKELAAIKEETDQVNKSRKSAQEGSRAEILGLEDTWRKGIGKIIEVQVATDQLRAELVQRRRAAVR